MVFKKKYEIGSNQKRVTSKAYDNKPFDYEKERKQEHFKI